MKNLLKLSIIVLMVTIASNSFAQTFGIKAGMNFSSMTFKDNQGNLYTSTETHPGIHLGLTADFPLSEQLSFETGLLLSTKGLKIKESGQSAKINSTYLEVPLNLKALYTIGKAKMYTAFGPYLGYGIGGKSELTSNTETISSPIQWGSGSDSDLKRFDFGLNLGLGVEINKLQFGVSYGLGLSNIAPSNQDGLTLKNKVIGISVGVKFK